MGSLTIEESEKLLRSYWVLKNYSKQLNDHFVRDVTITTNTNKTKVVYIFTKAFLKDTLKITSNTK